MNSIAAEIEIEFAKPGDLHAILALLDASQLPRAEFGQQLANAFVARASEKIVGSAALEIYADGALLRSVAVDESVRGQGIGERLVLAALDTAIARGVNQIFLLTETASEYFPRFGFRKIPRAEVAPSVQRSVEFISACQDSAQAMVLELERVGSKQ